MIRITLTALLFAAAGITQAQEISERPVPMSMKSRTLVAAEARSAMPTSEIWDGRDARAATMSGMRSRDEVRAEAAKAAPQRLATSGIVGGM